ncbi:MAG: amidohydrolase family protein [Chloroflexi bacterium]|nr:amidohydrolase family protein [Chloroflexota bacterium]MXX66861.1 amidohydrolase family protein [Chloroflexota bacterium]MXX99276.1 amidohydrolase family protein [Chloroflexota bacterium]MXY12491.1 amidohydrolase family protein [Chloroflexota bacterium]MYB16291.1 amidohydrolase family protein [Chloroflexota bacterium]
MAVTSPGRDQASRRKLVSQIVDTDIHHGFEEAQEILDYVPSEYRERTSWYGLPVDFNPVQNNGGMRGGRSDLAFDYPEIPVSTRESSLLRCRETLLDRYDIDLGILTGGQMYGQTGAMDSQYASIMARAFNDWTLKRWLDEDDRLRYAMAVIPLDPQGAVAEIERLAGDPRVVAVHLNTGAMRPFGNPMYHPIWEAAAKHDLTLQLHLGGEGTGVHPPMTSAGFPTHYVERRMAEPGLYLPHVASFIFEGVFGKYPNLKLVLAESGFTCLPHYLWRMDACWKGLRHQVPWIKELPSEIFYRHVWVGTQPMYEYNEDHANLMKMVEWLRGDERFVYASDYPHWDWDDPNDAARTFPSEMRERVFNRNARKAYPRLQ